MYLFHWHNSECVYTYTSEDSNSTVGLQNGILKAFSLGWHAPTSPSNATCDVPNHIWLTNIFCTVHNLYYVLGYLLRCCTKQKLRVGSDQKSSTTTTSPVGNNLEVLWGKIKCQHILRYGILYSFTSDLFINFTNALYTYTVFNLSLTKICTWTKYCYCLGLSPETG